MITFTLTTVMREFAKNIRYFSTTYVHICIYVKRMSVSVGNPTGTGKVKSAIQY